jgi:hypothetical protein
MLNLALLLGLAAAAPLVPRQLPVNPQCPDYNGLVDSDGMGSMYKVECSALCAGGTQVTVTGAGGSPGATTTTECLAACDRKLNQPSPSLSNMASNIR